MVQIKWLVGLKFAEKSVLIATLTWIIHESILLKMQGVKDEAVVFHRESFVTKQIR
jgi:hypothetical protein